MIKRYLIAGILLWAPIWVTFLVLQFLLQLFDKIITLLPHQYQPDALFGFHIPGLGLIISLLLILLTGMLVSNVFGNYLVNIWDKMISRIPLVRSIYAGSKQVLQTVFSSDNQAFRKVVLVEYPRAGMWTLAFQTGLGMKLNNNLPEDLISVFIPTTPNPTSGFMLLVSAKDVVDLNMSVDAALKMIISLGVIAPEKF